MRQLAMLVAVLILFPACTVDTTMSREGTTAATPTTATTSGDTMVQTTLADDHPANQLLNNVYELSPHPAVVLPEDPTWTEDPLGERNWQFQFHSLRFTRSLREAWLETGDERYVERLEWLVRDWIDDNPLDDPPSRWSWNDHATAFRAIVFADLVDLVDLGDSLVQHGEVLADPEFYVEEGNHALNQAIGLFRVGCVLDRPDWQVLAVERMEKLIVESVDFQGVSNEQALDYQGYNHRRYSAAEDSLGDCGYRIPAAFARLDKMPEILEMATMPNGELPMLGDTERSNPRPLPEGRETWAIYDAGFAFARSDWTEDASFMSLRFGPPAKYHGHYDGMSVTFFANGKRQLIDSGKYGYYRNDPWRNWFKSPDAHNLVATDGRLQRKHTELISHSFSDGEHVFELRGEPYKGVRHERTVTYSTLDHTLLVEDVLSSDEERTFQQLWHLAPDHDVNITQLLGQEGRIVEGESDPIQGWVSFDYGEREPAPVMIFEETGLRARFVTLITP